MNQKLLKKIFIFAIVFSIFLPNLSFAKELSFEDEFEIYENENLSEIYDPLEKANRKIFIFNDYLDLYLIEHLAVFYRQKVPKPARSSVRNFLTNLSAPISSINSFLQGKTDNGLATFSSFLINSTIGIGGIFDVAGQKGVRYKSEDFGQTLGYYGVNSGAYLVMPIFGPSSIRDLGGFLVDKSVGPLDFNLLEIGGSANLVKNEYRISLAGASGVDKRESLIDILDGIKKESFDPYATIRSAYLQKRSTDIKF